ncbi:type II toxin-antitoxin system VapC family toxin, partial [Geoglobus sp.]
MIVLDTSYIIDYLRGVDAARDLVDDGDEIAITVITYHEIMTGLKRKKSRREEKILRRFLSEIRILPFDINAANESSSIAARLMAVGKAVNALDILIAGIAIASGAERIITGDS